MYKLRTSNGKNLEICDETLTNVLNLNDLIKENGVFKIYNNFGIRDAFVPVVVDRTLYNNSDNFSILYNNIEKDSEKLKLNEIYLFKTFDIISYNNTNVKLMKQTFDLIKQNINNDDIIDYFKVYFDGKENKHGLGSGFGNGLLYIVSLSLENDKEKAFEIYKELFNFCEFRYKEDFNLAYFCDIKPFTELNYKLVAEIYDEEKKAIFTINGEQQLININDKSNEDISKIKIILEDIRKETNVSNLEYKINKLNEVFGFDFIIPNETIYTIGGGVSEIVKIKENITYKDIDNIIENFNNNKNIENFDKLFER